MASDEVVMAMNPPAANSRHEGHIKISVKQVAVEGDGAILLTGPSSCGKGEIAKGLRRFLSMPPQLHVSMGELLRSTVQAARSDANYRERLGSQYGISDDVPVLTAVGSTHDLIDKVTRHQPGIGDRFECEPSQITQLDWLDYCVAEGLLIPDDWTERIIDVRLRESTDLRKRIFILDGYPRTTEAAQRLLSTLDELDIGVIKVIHLSITKDEMKARAGGRGRTDDTDEGLERRYQFYVEHVQPCIDYLKAELGTPHVALVDAHQPVFNSDGSLDLERSIRAVTSSVLEALGLPRFLLDLDEG
jgi:adenylate kinase family enzyme